MNSHRGWDPGAYNIAESFAESLQTNLYSCEWSRLLIEVNRSLNHPDIFSEISKQLPDEERKLLLKEIYLSYRDAVETEIEQMSKPVVHLSFHSFTPVWEGAERQVDIGILFDPSRKFEHEFCAKWKEELIRLLPQYIIRDNEPYKGTDDGFTTYLRTRFVDEQYAGIEIEVNQKYVGDPAFEIIQNGLIRSLPRT